MRSRLADLMDVQNQISAATVVSMGFFTAGMVRGWASPAIPSLQGTDGRGNFTDYSLSYAPLSKEQASWISSLTPLGALCGGLLSSLPLSRLGRRLTMVISSLLFIFSFLFLGISSLTESLGSIFAARALMGVGVGLTIPSAQIYVAECTESRIRGTLSSMPALFMAAGTLLTYIMGAYLPWHYLSYFCSAFPVLFLLGLSIMPESPSWLLSKNKSELAMKSLTWLRGNRNVDKELDMMLENIQRANFAATRAENDPYNVKKSACIDSSIMMPLFISMSLMFFQQWSGVNAVIFYTVTIFDSAGSTVNKNLATIIVGLVQFLATFVSIFLVDKAGRRILLIASGLIMAISSAAVGTFFYLKAIEQHEGLGWLPLTGLITFMIGYSVGFASVPYVLMGEILPRASRNLLGSISTGFNLLNTFLVIKLFVNLEILIGFYGVFWLYASVALGSCLFVMIFVPETKGKSLEEIETHFRK